MVTVVIGSYFEEEHVRRIGEVDGRLRVLYREDLVPPPRWPGDHVGPEDWRRTQEEEEEFLAMLAEAEVLYDFPRGHAQDLTEAAPNLERLRRDKAERVWRQTHTETLEGKTLCIVGVGSIGRAIAERVRPFGTRVVGVKRTVREDDPAWRHADELYPTDRLHDALGEADYVAITLPGTPETRHLVDTGALEAVKPGAYLVNVGRGTVVDEEALVEALKSGHLSGGAR